MSYGRKLDFVAGGLSRLLHVRGARENTLSELPHYYDLPADQMFTAPGVLPRMQVERGLLARALSTTTLSWPSRHEPISEPYRRRHQRDYPKNHTAWARWLRPEGRHRRTCLVYVHGWLEPGSWAEEATLFRVWQRQLDVDIVHLALPFHGRRMPSGSLFSGELFWTADLVRSMEGVRQAIFDARSLVAWLRAEGYERVGVTGLSLGGSLTMLLAALEPTPDFIIPIIAHLRLAEVLEDAPIMWRVKSDLEGWGVNRAARAEIFRRLGLSSYAPRLDPRRQLWIEAEDDVYIDAQLVREQWRAWGEPQIHWVAGGHMTLPFHIPAFTKRIDAFLSQVHP